MFQTLSSAKVVQVSETSVDPDCLMLGIRRKSDVSILLFSRNDTRCFLQGIETRSLEHLLGLSSSLHQHYHSIHPHYIKQHFIHTSIRLIPPLSFKPPSLSRQDGLSRTGSHSRVVGCHPRPESRCSHRRSQFDRSWNLESSQTSQASARSSKRDCSRASSRWTDSWCWWSSHRRSSHHSNIAIWRQHVDSCLGRAIGSCACKPICHDRWLNQSRHQDSVEENPQVGRQRHDDV